MKRFWDKVEKSADPNGCWEWIGGSNKYGYGHFKYRGTTMRAHRVVWELVFGVIPDGFDVLHHCDNRLCVNPKHLYLGTDKENTYDKVKRDRCNSKLNNKKAGEIRKKYAAAGLTCQQLADEYSIARSTISRIISGKFWKSAPGPIEPKDLRKKVTKWEVDKIREKYRSGVCQRNLAIEFGIAQTTVSQIVRGLTWQG